MPHQCIRCNRFYSDGAAELLSGCSCGGRLFFYIKKERLEESRNITENLTKKEKLQIEHDVLDLVGQPKSEEPVILDLESIRILKPGSYELDLVRLFKKEPVVFRLEEGKYIIDLAKSFATGHNKE
ncbi:hypothetical protein COT48_05735 [Candidatus Woesearchaeota archaeon CG08_land_8_20_14_0_20_47_9]|nr:MAG: hypothetical protein AUJ69_00890 [Candidatus Woesearchaeota archaeon CG1_02_47_18]PIN76692.1 MAG: hypothetical protein COV22_00050 [Candidatus Woesearchaeota archaeon CG10_big_fil_rev_8_21_14_0_10_47_5]PIO03243.1 MAG: hypothetical protein COT48_05735 [Candidatus Woesearchaeota archaeon CG08_land_8_20_14_0_20_47_9]HII29646.1 hypothetical protein [Candidatus Woesearchaeota archaeon]